MLYNRFRIRSGIEVVITSYIGTVVVASSGPWVRIPLTPPDNYISNLYIEMLIVLKNNSGLIYIL